MYDLIIIGGGPAGYHAAERAAHQGYKTLMFEKREFGGVCLNEGCIPTKTFLYSAKLKDGAAHGEKYGVVTHDITLNHNKVLERKKKVVAALTGGIRAQLKSAGVETVFGEAVIKRRSAAGFDVESEGNVYTGRRILVATGSVPVIPPIPGLKSMLENGFAVTSREILDEQIVPKQLIVIGGGVIGLELASYFASAGAEITVIEMLSSIGGNIDAEIAGILKKNLEKKGIRFLLGCRVVEIKQGCVVYEDMTGNRECTADKVLLCIGRQAFSDGLGLENIDVETERGVVKTDEWMRTNIAGVYAAGDVNGKSMLAHTAYREAEITISNISGSREKMNYSAIPAVIYTNPEVAGVGDTYETAIQKGFPAITKTISLRFSGRYMAENEGGDGIAKIVINGATNRIVGFHMIGNSASEIIYGAAMMIDREMTLESIKRTVFPHPTVSEILKEII
jgi:dihydrolipoamide dehydrogenase